MAKRTRYELERLGDVWYRVGEGDPEPLSAFCAWLRERGLGDAADALPKVVTRAEKYNATWFRIALVGADWGQPEYERDPTVADGPGLSGLMSRLDARLAALEGRTPPPVRAAELAAVDDLARRLEELNERLAAVEAAQDKPPAPPKMLLDQMAATAAAVEGLTEAMAVVQAQMEEAPAPGIDDDTLADLSERVAALGKEVQALQKAHSDLAHVTTAEPRRPAAPAADDLRAALADAVRPQVAALRRQLEAHIAEGQRRIIERIHAVVSEAGLTFDRYVGALTAWVEAHRAALAPPTLLASLEGADPLTAVVTLATLEARAGAGAGPEPVDLVLRICRDVYARDDQVPESVRDPLTELCGAVGLQPIVPSPGATFDGRIHEVVEGGDRTQKIAAIRAPGFTRTDGTVAARAQVVLERVARRIPGLERLPT